PGRRRTGTAASRWRARASGPTTPARRCPSSGSGGKRRMKRELLQLLWPYLRRYRLRLAGGMLILLVNTGVFVLIPFIIHLAIDDLGHGLTSAKLLKYCLMLMGTVTARAILNYYQRLILITISRLIEFDLRNDLLAKVETLSLGFFQQY